MDGGGLVVYASEMGNTTSELQMIEYLAGLQDCVWLADGATSYSDMVSSFSLDIRLMRDRLEYTYSYMRGTDDLPYLFTSSGLPSVQSLIDADDGIDFEHGTNRDLYDTLASVSGNVFKVPYDLAFLGATEDMETLSSLAPVYIDSSGGSSGSLDLYIGYPLGRSMIYRDSYTLSGPARSMLDSVVSDERDVRRYISYTLGYRYTTSALYTATVSDITADGLAYRLTSSSVDDGLKVRLSLDTVPHDSSGATWSVSPYSLSDALSTSTASPTMTTESTSIYQIGAGSYTSSNQITSGSTYLNPALASVYYFAPGEGWLVCDLWADNLITGSSDVWGAFGSIITTPASGIYRIPSIDTLDAVYAGTASPDTMLGVDVTGGVIDDPIIVPDYSADIDAVRQSIDDLRAGILGGDYAPGLRDADDQLSNAITDLDDAEDEAFSPLDDFDTDTVFHLPNFLALSDIMDHLSTCWDALGDMTTPLILTLSIGLACFIIGI